MKAFPINDQLSISATLKGVYQYGFFRDNIDETGKSVAIKGRGVGGVDLEVDFKSTEADQFYILLQYSADNGLNDIWAGALHRSDIHWKTMSEILTEVAEIIFTKLGINIASNSTITGA